MGNDMVKGRTAWNKGLTAQTDTRVAKYAKPLSSASLEHRRSVCKSQKGISKSEKHKQNLRVARQTSPLSWKTWASRLLPLGIDAETVLQKTKEGFRFCRGHGGFLPLGEFCKHAAWMCRPCEHSRNVSRDYNVPLDWYQRQFEKQHGLCALCEKPPEPGKFLSVDHDHLCCPKPGESCGKCVRGLLCNRCNPCLQVMIDTKWLERAAIYVDR